MTDTRMRISRAGFFVDGVFLADGHCLNDAACLPIDAVLIVDGVQGSLQGMEGGEERRFLLARLHPPFPSRRIGGGTDAVVEEVVVEGLECVVFADVGGVEMGGGGKDGVTNRKTKILFAEIVFFYI